MLLDPEEALTQNNAATVFQTYVMYLLTRKAFFVIKTGYMNILLVGIERGDTLAVFAGMSLPAMVREEGGSYRFIGPAYAHGIMDGEAWEERDALAEEFPLIWSTS